MDVDRAYNQVRRELAEVGLLAEGLYLDHIEVCISSAPSDGEAGYLFEDVSVRSMYGHRPGVIYLPSDCLMKNRFQVARSWILCGMSLLTPGITRILSFSG